MERILERAAIVEPAGKSVKDAEWTVCGLQKGSLICPSRFDRRGGFLQLSWGDSAFL